ncbi:MAG: hypothetical protein ABI740_08320 [Alphaproteobacteria bacterium]
MATKKPSKHDLVSHERRVRRASARYRLSLLKDPKPFGKVLEHGGYMLRMDGTSDIVFGNTLYKFDADLEDIEKYLEKLDAECNG